MREVNEKKSDSHFPNHLTPNHKAQEEIMGFMLIVVMVIVIGLAFMFFFTPKPVERNDLDIENLIYAWKTVDIEGMSVERMIEDCETGYCDDLSEKAVGVLDSAVDKKWPGSINGYALNITEGSQFSYSKGNLTGNWKSASAVVSKSSVSLKIYYP